MFSRALSAADLQSLEVMNSLLVGVEGWRVGWWWAGLWDGCARRGVGLWGGLRCRCGAQGVAQGPVGLWGGEGPAKGRRLGLPGLPGTHPRLGLGGVRILHGMCAAAPGNHSRTPGCGVQGDDFVAGLSEGSLLGNERFTTLRLTGCGLGDSAVVRLAKAIEGVGE